MRRKVAPLVPSLLGERIIAPPVYLIDSTYCPSHSYEIVTGFPLVSTKRLAQAIGARLLLVFIKVGRRPANIFS